MSTGTEWHDEVRRRAEAFFTKERRLALFGTKQLIVDPVENAPLFRVMGLIHRDGSMVLSDVRKLMQISHLVVLFEPPLSDLMKRHETVRVLDVGCGSSYLTLMLAWCFRYRFNHAAQILGIDRTAVVVEKSRERAARLGLTDVLRFEQAELTTADAAPLLATWDRAFGAADAPHAVIALHACDVATDAALAIGVNLEAPFVAVAPCCHAQLANAWRDTSPKPLATLATSPHLRRESGAMFTDALRLAALRGRGYDAQAVEFVPSQHTPKNTLLRARLRHPAVAENFTEYRALRAVLGDPILAIDSLTW